MNAEGDTLNGGAEFDECLSDATHDCHAHATCSDSRRSFECNCNDGFFGDGKATTLT